MAELVGRAVRDDHTLVDHKDSLAHGLHLGQDVGAEHHRVVAAQILDQVADLDDLLRVKADGRLVENQHRRIAQQGLRDADALLVALGQVRNQALVNIVDLDKIADLLDVLLLRDLDLLEVVHEIKVLLDRHVHIQRRHLRQIADELLHLGGLVEDAVSRHRHFALAGGEVACDDVHRGGLTGAVRPQKAQDSTLLHGEAHMVQSHV